MVVASAGSRLRVGTISALALASCLPITFGCRPSDAGDSGTGSRTKDAAAFSIPLAASGADSRAIADDLKQEQAVVKEALAGLAGKSSPTDMSLARAESLSQKNLPPIPEIPLQLPNNADGKFQPGLVVCAPAASPGMSETDAAFAVGCGEWLELAAAGQPNMGQSPLLSSITRAQRERKFSDLRLTPTQAIDLASSTGATHVAVATVTPGNTPGGTMQITYTVYRVDTGQPVEGSPLVVSGSREQILAGLPNLAVDIARRTGLSAPEPPIPVGLEPTQIEVCGRFGLTGPISSTDHAYIRGYAGPSPLPGILAMDDSAIGGFTAQRRIADDLLTRNAPKNSLVWGAAAFINAYTVVPHRAALLALRKNYPHSYALAHAAVYEERSGGDQAGVMSAARALVQNAPRNPEAYLSLAGTIRDEAQNVRRGRVSARITGNEQQFIDRAYLTMEICDLHCIEIDPLHETAWQRMMESATCAGDDAVARKAYPVALKRSASLADVYDWALEMFQDKWGGTPEELSQAAQAASAAEYPTAGEAGQIAAKLLDLHFTRESQALSTRYFDRLNDRIAKNSNDGRAHADKADILQSLPGHETQALGEYRKAVALLPQDINLWYAYAAACRNTNNATEACDAYRHILARDTDNANVLIRLGYILQDTNKLDEAEGSLRKGLVFAPNDLAANQALGNVSYQRSHWAQAADAYQKSIRLGNEDPNCYMALTMALTYAGNPKEAIRWGEEAVGLFTGQENNSANAQDGKYYSDLHSILGRAYFKAGRLQDALQQEETALTLYSRNMPACENLGLICNALGKRGKARALWQSVLNYPVDIDLSTLEEAKAMLAKYPENGR